MNGETLENELLRHRPFLLRLAAGLVGPDEADDLVQDVWTRALVAGRPAPRSARAWLARVARNLATSGFRSRSRRERREREHAPQEGGSSGLEETAERFELAQRIGAAVQALEEPYRSVVLLRYFEGLEHAAIAAKLGVPLATVRTRQQRALSQLREKLDREFGGREAWSVGLGAWLTRAAEVGAAPIVGTWLVIAGVAAATIVGVFAWKTRTTSGAADTSLLWVKADGRAPDPKNEASASTAVKREPLSPASSDPEALSIPSHVLVGRVLDLDANECAETSLEVIGMHPTFSLSDDRANGRLEPDGSFEIDLEPLYRGQVVPQEFALRVDHLRYVAALERVLVEEGVSTPEGGIRHVVREIRLVPAGVVHGRVEFADGSPAAGAFVEAFRRLAAIPEPESRALARCADDGSFRLRVAETGPHVLAVLRAGWRPTTLAVDVTIGAQQEIVARLEPGLAIEGSASVLGVPQASLSLECAPTRRRDSVDSAAKVADLGWIDGHFEWTRLFSESTAGGAYRIGGLAPVEYQLYISDVPGTNGGFGRRPKYRSVTAPAENVELEFDAAILTLDIVAPFPSEDNGRAEIECEGTRINPWFRLGEGPVRVVTPTGAALAVRATMPGLSSRRLELIAPGPGEELRQRIELLPEAPARLRLAVRGDAASPIAGLALAFHARSDEKQPEGHRSALFREEFSLGDEPVVRPVPAGDYWIEARVRDPEQYSNRSFYVPVEFALELSPGTEVEHELAFELGGLLRIDARTNLETRERVQFELFDALGTKLPVLFVFQDPERGGIYGSWRLEAWGLGELTSSLMPGSYELRLWNDELIEQRLAFQIEPGETTELAVTLEPR